MGIHHIRIEYPSEEKSKEKNRKTPDVKEHSEEIEYNRKGNKKDQLPPEASEPGSNKS